MKYTVEDDKILVFSKDEFNPKHILECGQVFSYVQTNEGFTVFSADKMAKIIEKEGFFEILTQNTEYFINYFDLNNDYQEIKSRLLKIYPHMKSAIDFGYGIRILKQDYFETIISFIVSANNNIKRIQKILFALREKYGDKKDGYFAFPTISQLKNASVEDFKALGAGYRDKYLYNVVRELEKIDLNEFEKLPTQELAKRLLALSGVGPKVADCIMLFAFSRGDVFPVDTWIEKVYCTYFKEEHNRSIIRKNLVNVFKNDSGYAQQYLFYSQRSFAE